MDRLNDQNVHSSETDLRAASIRAEVEKKVEQIEADITVETDNGFINNMQSVEVKSRSCSVSELKDSAIDHLQNELDKAQKELKLKDEKVVTLTKVRDKIGLEIEELTACLFEEANKMVQEAKEKQAKAEKHAKETDMKLSVLQEELAALKSLIDTKVLCTDTPSLPVNKKVTPTPSPKSTFKFKTPSLIQDQVQNLHQLNGVPNHDKVDQSSDPECQLPSYKKEQYESDPILHREFVSWRQNPIIDKNCPFFQRLYTEDINICMSFENKQLAEQVLQAIETNTLSIENVSGKCKLSKMCALLCMPRWCPYVITLGGEDHYYISSLSRNRIVAVCELLCFLTYVQKGLIEKNVHDVYLELLQKRKAIAVARLGLPEANNT